MKYLFHVGFISVKIELHVTRNPEKWWKVRKLTLAFRGEMQIAWDFRTFVSNDVTIDVLCSTPMYVAQRLLFAIMQWMKGHSVPSSSCVPNAICWRCCTSWISQSFHVIVLFKCIFVYYETHRQVPRRIFYINDFSLQQ